MTTVESQETTVITTIEPEVYTEFTTMAPTKRTSYYFNEPHCEPLTTMLHATVDSDSIYIGAVATLTCDLGYIFPDGSDVRAVYCMKSREWSGEHRCIYDQSRYCQNDINLINNDCSYSPCRTVYDSYMWSCDNGIVDVCNDQCMTEEHDYVGLVETRYSNFCKPLETECEYIPYIENAYITETDNVYIIDVQCCYGYRMDNGYQHTIVQCINGDWIAEYENCEQKEDCSAYNLKCYLQACPPIHLPGHASLSTNHTLVDTTVQIICELGYKLTDLSMEEVGPPVNQMSVTCVDEGEVSGIRWSDDNVQRLLCQPVYCADPEVVPNALYYMTGQMAGHNLTYTCFANHRFINGDQELNVTCDLSGIWQSDIPSSIALDCKLHRCPNLQEDLRKANQQHVPFIESDIGSKAPLECISGYITTKGTTTSDVTCQQNGSWTEVSECQEVVCPTWKNHVRLLVNTTDRVYGAVAELSCHAGYLFRGIPFETVVVQCNAEGNWIEKNNGTGYSNGKSNYNSTVDGYVDAILCDPIDCGPPRSYQNALISYLRTSYGSTGTVACDIGFWLKSGIAEWSVACNHRGSWEESYDCVPSLVIGTILEGNIRCRCTRVLCPPIIPDGINQSYINTTVHEFGTFVNYTCMLDTSEVVSTYHVCNINGSWVPDIVCEAPVKKNSFEAVEAPESESIGLIVITVISSILLMIFLLDIVTFRRTV